MQFFSIFPRREETVPSQNYIYFQNYFLQNICPKIHVFARAHIGNEVKGIAIYLTPIYSRFCIWL